MYRDELENMGITSAQENTILMQIKQVIKSPINAVSSVGAGIYSFFNGINQKIQASKNKALFEFKQNIKKILVEYVETDL